MLSILIPTYNYNVFPLASQLVNQAKMEGISFELICFDDGSGSIINAENEKINSLSNCKFIATTQNVGLSNNRNALVEASKYESVLFIDGDSLLPDENFIKRYSEVLSKNAEIIYGGTIYSDNKSHKDKLRWKYGLKREVFSAIEREKANYKSLHFNNTVVRRRLFKTLSFEKSFTQYGHEDTLLAFILQKQKVPVIHIDNPVVHCGIDSNIDFINKTERSLENLNLIYKSKLIDPTFVTFLNAFRKFQRFKLNYLFALIHKLCYSLFKRQLSSKNPSIIIFDFFRLSYFSYINLKA